MEIIINNADFSTLGLGNVRWIENYIKVAGITNPTHITALRAMYTKYIASGFDSKFEVFRLFITGVTSNDTLNVINPVLGNNFSLAFKNDAPNKHTTSGYAPLTSNAYAQAGYEIKDLNNFHLHCFNNSIAEFVLGRIATSSVAGDYPSGIGSNAYSLQMFCRGATSSFACNHLGTQINGGNSNVSGLYSVYKNGNSVKAAKDNANVGSLTSSAVVIDPTIKLKILEGTAGVTSNGLPNYPSTNGKALFIGYGASTWSDADEANLYTMITDLKTALGV